MVRVIVPVNSRGPVKAVLTPEGILTPGGIPPEDILSPYAMALANSVYSMARQPLSEQSANIQTKNHASPAGGQKRSFQTYSEADDCELMVIPDDCDKVRRKLRSYIDTGEMKLGELHDALGVSGRSFNNFMSQHGKDKGSRTDTYPAAYHFFKDREARGIKIPTKRVKKGEEKKIDLSDIKLDGEESTSVPVYDTCDEVRKKINAHLRDQSVTKAGFLREIVKTYPTERKIQSKQLETFLGQNGALCGNTSAAYYAGYVYFEKLRIKEDKPKSKHREEMEKRHRKGVDTSRRFDKALCGPGERPYFDQYGELHFAQTGRK